MGKPKPQATLPDVPPIDLPPQIKRKLDHLLLDETFAVELGISVQDFMDQIIRYYADVPNLKDVAYTWKRMSAKTKATITFAGLCDKCDITARELFMVLSAYCYDSGYDRAKRLIGLNMPAVIEASLVNALMQGQLSQEERREWLKAWGVFTVPKGADTRIEVHAHAQAAAAVSAQAAGLPAFEDTISDDEDDYRVPRQLTEGSPAIDLPAFMQVEPNRVPSRDSGPADQTVREETWLPPETPHD